MKKFLAMLLAVVMVLSMAACSKQPAKDPNKGSDDPNQTATITNPDQINDEMTSEDGKYEIAFITDVGQLKDKSFNQGTYDGVKLYAANNKLSYKYYQPANKDQATDDDRYEAMKAAVENGAKVVVCAGFMQEGALRMAAKEFPKVQFCHSTGTKAHTEGLDNYHNAFASIYEGRYLAGVAAGLKLNEMIDNGDFAAEDAKIGYVGAFTYAEVVSGYTSFFLGARSVCPTATMEVTFTGSWYDETAEKEAANKLIANGCKLVSQHADSMGAPTACETAGVPNVSYNGSTVAACPNTFIVSSRIDWTPFFVYAINCVASGEDIGYDWTGTLATGSVVLTDVNEQAAAAGTAEKIAEVMKALEDGSVKVFDTATFTVNGETVTTYLADVDDLGDYVGETEAISDGVFLESFYRSAPYFDLDIDGITNLDA